MLAVIPLLVAGLAGCREEPQQAADEPKPEAAKSDEGSDATVGEIKKLDTRVVSDDSSPDGLVTPTRDQAVRVLSKVQSAIKAGEQHSKDFEAEVNVLKHFHRAPEWNGKRFKGEVSGLLQWRFLSGEPGEPGVPRAFLPPVIAELSQHGAWGRADELFDKGRLRRRVALHDVKADDCYALVLKNGKAETIFHWSGKIFTILHYSEPAVRQNNDSFVMKTVEGMPNRDGSGHALSHYHLGNYGPHAEIAIPAISEWLTHDDPWHRISAAITLWKIDRRVSVSVPPLVNMLADAKLDIRHRAMAAEGLGIIGPQASAAKASLLAAMGEKQSRLRLSAAWALWKTTGDLKSTRPVMLDLLEDGDIDNSFVAAKTLGEMGWDKESLTVLSAVLGADPDRIYLARRLKDSLVEALASDDVEIRKGAVAVLSKVEPHEKSVSDALEKAWEEGPRPDPEEMAPPPAVAELTQEEKVAALKKYGRGSFFGSGKELHLRGIRALGGLPYLDGLSGLERLVLDLSQDENVTDAELARLEGLTVVDLSLDLSHTNITDAGIAHLEGLAGLNRLNLSGTKITDAGLAHLEGLTGLERLELFSTKVSDAGLAHLKGLTGLGELDLRRTKVTDAGLVHLKGLTELVGLNLEGTKVTDAGLVHLKGLTGLVGLNLEGTKVTDAGLVHLKGLAGLVGLNLSATKVTDAGLVHLKGLAGLNLLILEGTKVTDAGLVHLKGLAGLNLLFLRDTKVTDVGVAKLRAALPKSRIYRSKGWPG
jgi:hypothetical protein